MVLMATRDVIRHIWLLPLTVEKQQILYTGTSTVRITKVS